MAIVAGSLLQIEQDRILEIINRSLDFILPELDPIWVGTLNTSIGVGPADLIGRDMLVKKVYMGSFTGVLEQAQPRGNFPLYGDDTDTLGAKIFQQNLAQTWPDATGGPNPLPYRLAIPMKAMLSNLLMTLGELTMEALPATIGEVLVPKLQGHARNMAHTVSTYMYLNQVNDYRLCTITNIGAIAANAFSFEPNNEAVDRFAVGQRVDIFEGTAGIVRKNADNGNAVRNECMVSAVDELTNTVTLVSDISPTDWENSDNDDDSPLNGDTVVFANSADGLTGDYTGIAGIRSYLKTGTGLADNFILGDEFESAADGRLDVTVHPEHKSFLKAVNDVLTESRLIRYVKRFNHSKRRYGFSIDTLLAPDGVWQAYWEQKIGREIIDRTGRIASITDEGLEDGFAVVVEGQRLAGFTTNYIESGTLYGLKRGDNNWKRYMPPSRKMRKVDGVPDFAPFEFVAPALTNSGAVQLPVYDTSGNTTLVTEGAQLPGWLRMQLIPDQFAGLILTGLTESKDFSD